MMSTARANLSVGPPYDGCVYLNDSFAPIEFRIESDSPLLENLAEAWERQMEAAVREIQTISRDDPTIDFPVTGRDRRRRGSDLDRLGGEDVQPQPLRHMPGDQLTPDAVARLVEEGREGPEAPLAG